MRISLSILLGAGAIALAGCSTAFETPTSLTTADRLSVGERRLVPVMEYADGEALAAVSELHLPLAAIAPGAEIDSGLDPARIDRLRAVVSKELCQRFARGRGFGRRARGPPAKCRSCGSRPQ